MSQKVLVITHGRHSYVQADYWTRDRLIINGRRDWPTARGVDSFKVVRGRVETLERFNDSATVTTRYVLRSDLVCANKRKWLTPDEYSQLPESDQPLYSAETELRDQPSTPLDFTVVDGDAEPREMPTGIRPQEPRHIDVLPWFWWTLPCIATPDHVFQALAERVKALDPAQFAVTVYSNIKHLRVTLHAVNIGGVSYRPDSYLVHIDRGCQSIAGEDLDDTLRKVSAWCDERMRPVAAILAVKDCPTCNRPLKKGTSFRAHDSKRRIVQHDIS